MGHRRLIWVYTATMTVLSVVYLVWPAVSSVLVSLLSVASAGAIGFGIYRYRPQRSVAWMLLAAALVLAGAARVVYDALPGQPGTLKPGISSVWLLHLAMFLLLAIGLLSLIRNGIRRAPAIIDTLVIALGAGLLLGVLIAIPYAGKPGLGRLWETVRIAYVARDVVVLAIGAGLVMTARRTACVRLLGLGVAAFVAYDVLFRVGRTRGEWLAGTPLDILWLLFFLAFGAAALVPSMTSFDAPDAHQARAVDGEQDTGVRLGVVLAAALIPSIVLMVGLVAPPRWYEGALVLVATLVLLLTFARLLNVTARLHSHVRAEQVVRNAVSEFADAHGRPDVVTALDRAVGRLVRPGRDYRVALGSAPVTVPAASDGHRLYDIASLPRPIADQLGGRGVALMLPLDTAVPAVAASHREPSETERRGDGLGEPVSFFVRADPRLLAHLTPRFQALAKQAGLALQRLRLNQQVLQHSRETYFRTLVQKSTDVILIIDDDNRIRYATPSAQTLVGPLSLTGVSLLDLVEPAHRDVAAQLLQQAREPGANEAAAPNPDTLVRVAWTLPSVAGSSADVEIACRDLRSDPSIGGLVLTLHNVTEQKRLENELAQQAFHDPLTGLSNRLLFHEQLDATITRHIGSPAFAALLFIDIDDMKLVNDGLGHEAGDALLKAVAHRLNDFIANRHGSDADTAARLGGDEFVVLLTGILDQKTVEQAADVLTAELSRPVSFGAGEVPCAASLGVATTVEAVNARDLLRNADLALYAAKGTGKRHWQRYEPWMRAGLTDRLALRTALEHAVDNNEFFLEYQPIVALPGRASVGFEALLRWQHPTRGRLAPDEFIDVAEESGLIADIGEWVLATAFSAARRWQRQSVPPAPYVAINVSARQFRGSAFVGTFQRLLAESDLPPARVVLEITESLLLREDDRVWVDLQRLRGTGIRIAIDDFGTGYSALSYLRHVPLDVVKLDRAFTASMTTSARQRELVRGIVGLAHTLDLQVIAEGIETEDECAEAGRAGCDCGQGYLFSSPLPDHDAAQWVNAESAA